jgi:hypothetical protein
MDWKNVILLIVAGINLGSALMVYFLNPKNRINIYYALMVFCVAIWIFGLATFRSIQTERGVNFLIFIYYSASALVSFFLYKFSIYFPYQKKLLTLKMEILAFVGLIIIVITCLPALLVRDVILDPPNNVVKLNFLDDIIYAVVFLLFIIFGYINLIKKFLENGGFIRIQLKYFIICSSIAFIFGVIFDLIYPLAGNYKLIWLGPYFSFTMVIFISYILFFSNNSKIK